ncbi:MAG: tRNA (adenine37-N(6))-methyltransferase TrmN6 [Candidatus Carbobacillus altaicus]|uniref:tRNA (Adenine37-N(6))-methyltransferase TrmN6 n=1 Tax=Candidatus Carbonibacillus altaicus TaxID=2163959 RepID=A0A2R6Y209_9BACL|nr:MAG: tRNA (adenine37-N(6))-methyltransferase TrmN6 [Candidatus Carbobacillus altaicus]
MADNPCTRHMDHMDKGLLYPNERMDRLGKTPYCLIQRDDVFRFGHDAVLLAHFATPPKKGMIADLCTGTGAVAFFLTVKTTSPVLAVEWQGELCDMARRSVLLNALEARLSVMQEDVRNLPWMLGKAVFDYITINPPYVSEASFPQNKRKALAVARHEIMLKLAEWTEALALLLKPLGRAAIVYRTDRFYELFQALIVRDLIVKRLRFVYPHAHKNADLVLVEVQKKGRVRGTVVEPPLIVHRADGSFTDEMEAIYDSFRS